MSKLDELIQQYCPDGVEWKTLGEVCKKVFAGGTPTSSNSAYYGGDIPWLRSGEVNFNEIISTEKTITEEGYNSSSAKWIEKHSVLVALTGATVARSAMTMIELTANQSVCALTPQRDILYYRYLYYWVSKSYSQLRGMAQGTLTSLNLNIIKSFEIPVPPLPVQEEIAGILDTFTELQAELQAELQKRLQQYNYYKSHLLAGDYPTMKIGDITRVFSAARVHKDEWKTSGVPFYRSSDVMSFHRGEKNSRGEVFISEELFESLSAKSGKIRIGDLLVTGGGSIGVPYLVDFEPLYVKDADLLCIVKNDILDNKFLYHYMQSEQFKNYLASITHDATIAHYTISQIKETPVPVPSWEEQQRIISILDKFDSLTNDLTAGLPAEIEKRKQQYEYYRDKLLTFKRA